MPPWKVLTTSAWENEKQLGMKGEGRGTEVFSDHFLSSSTLQKTSTPLVPQPPHPQFRCCGISNPTCKRNIFVEASVSVVCSERRFCAFTDACTGCGRGPVNKTSAQLSTLNFFFYILSTPSVWKAVDRGRGKLRGTCGLGMPVYLLVHAPWAINEMSPLLHVICWCGRVAVSQAALLIVCS